MIPLIIAGIIVLLLEWDYLENLEDEQIQDYSEGRTESEDTAN
jgi:hypothetical protein